MNPQADLARLEGHDPIDVLSSTHALLEAIVNSTPNTTLCARPFPGRWTPNEILGHLVDHEWAAGVRFRNALLTDPPGLLGYDQEGWVTGRRVNDIEPRAHVEEFGRLRPHNLRLVTAMPAEALERAVPLTSPAGGTATVRQIIVRYAAHDLTHLDQLRRYFEAAT